MFGPLQEQLEQDLSLVTSYEFQQNLKKRQSLVPARDNSREMSILSDRASMHGDRLDASNSLLTVKGQHTQKASHLEVRNKKLLFSL